MNNKINEEDVEKANIETKDIKESLLTIKNLILEKLINYDIKEISVFLDIKTKKVKVYLLPESEYKKTTMYEF